jgi:hypothetical protein
MDFGLFDRFAQRRAIAKFKRSSVGQALSQYTEEYFVTGSVMRHFSPDAKQDVINQFGTSIAEIVLADNPFLKLRAELAGITYAYANLQVLGLVPDEKPDLHFADCPYISGELNQHIVRCAEHNVELKELLWKQPDLTARDLTGFCNVRCARYLYFLNGYEIVRRLEFKDFEPTPNKDWLRPLVTSALIWCEDTYRQKIGLPSLLPTFEGLLHSTFLDSVTSGQSNPLFEWETRCERVHAEAIRGLDHTRQHQPERESG